MNEVAKGGTIPGLSIDGRGHHVAAYFLQGKQETVDLTELLGVGLTVRIVDEDPPMLLHMLTLIGPWRYTLFQAWAESKHRLESAESAFEAWWSNRYLQAEATLQKEKALAVQAKVRSVSEQVSKALVEARLVDDNRTEWLEWQSQIEGCRHLERATEGLFKAVDRRGVELSTVITNLGFLLRKP